METLVTTQWLADQIGASDLRIVDASWHLDGRDPRAEYEAGHLPGAVFMDLAEIADTATSLPMMLPSAEKFASRMQSLGLGDGSRIVIYDDSNLHTSARAWWMLHVFGAHNVAVLDGGLRKWREEGRDMVSGKETVRHRHFTVWQDKAQVRTLDQMLANLSSHAEQVVDARPAERFQGIGAEPRPGVEPGHIPGSRNVPASSLFGPDNCYKSLDDIRALFVAAGIDPDKPVVTTCGSGVTAAVLAFALHRLGNSHVALYDGSWAEWGGNPDTPKALGPA